MPQLTVAYLAEAIACGFAVGALLLLSLTLLPGSRKTALQLWPVLASEAAILAAGILPWFLPRSALFVVLLAAACRIGLESGTVYGLMAQKKLAVVAALALICVSAMSWFTATWLFIPVFTLLLGTSILIAGLQPASFTGLLSRFAIFPLLPVAAFSHAAAEEMLAPLLVLAFFLVEIFDSFSLLGGKLYGRTPLVPRLSPRKTWEGLATGGTALFVTLFLLAAWLQLPLLPMILGGLIVAAAALAGDLLGSQAKRRAGVKDYPPVMIVQGGLLDITDAWLVAGPCLAALAVLLHWT